MTYPLSSPVTDGMPTAYTHYNDLRLDALTLGNAEADGVGLGVGLSRYQDNIKLEPLATNRLRVPYNALRPPTLMINGALCQAAADVDLAPGSISGAAALWYIFATRIAGATTFTLTANSSSAEGLNARRIAEIYWTGAACNYASLFVYPPGRPGVYYARVSRVAAQSINTATQTAISFDTEEADTDAMYAAGSPAQVTITHAGLYLVTAHLTPATAGAYYSSVYLRLNGTTTIAACNTTGHAACAPLPALATLRSFLAGDYIDLIALHNQGGAVNHTATLAVAALGA